MRNFVLFFFLLAAASLTARTIDVCADCEVQSIKEAVALAETGDRICVGEGLYKEHNIVIDKPLALLADPGAVIDGELKGEIILINSDGVTLDGFEIINVGQSTTKEFAAVRIKGSEDFLVENLTIQKPYFGIFLEKSNRGIIRNNHILGDAVMEFTSGNAIHMWYSHHNQIVGNYGIRVRDGIYLEFSNYNFISENHSEHNIRYGLHFMFCHNNEVADNVFENNGAGIAIMFSKQMNMHDNVMLNNWGAAAYGLLLKEASDCRVVGNDFIRNTTAINVEGSNRVLYEYNNFQSNGWAINSRGGNYENIYERNNFLSNSFDVAFNTSATGGNIFKGNYWSSYNGYDLDRDGVGDVPFRPVKLFSYLTQRSPESIILLRSMFIDLVDFSEKVSPVFTPDNLRDDRPSMKLIKREYADHD